jgi:hypothetical protein
MVGFCKCRGEPVILGGFKCRLSGTGRGTSQTVLWYSLSQPLIKPPVCDLWSGPFRCFSTVAGRSPDWIKVKNRTHPAMERVKEAFS